MTTRLTKIGDSLAIILDRPMLESVDIREETPLEVAVDGHRLIISSTVHSDQLRAALDRVNKAHAPTFRRLAE